MIHEEICTYEVCKLAKEKGFNVPTDRYYHIYDDVIEAQNSLEMTGDGCADFYNSLNRCRCAAPTQSLLQRWLREEKDIQITIEPKLDKFGAWVWGHYDWVIRIYNEYSPIYYSQYNGDNFDAYELALEDAINYSLKNLV
jgi:hypothetical protein